MSVETDEALIARVARGDADALDQLFRRHHGRVYALCVRLSGNRTTADDLVQETFLKVLRYAGSYKARARFTTWLYRITRNVCLEDHARQARGAQLVIEPVVTPERDPRIELIERALLELPEAARAALVLSRWHDLPYADVGRVLGCSEGTARVRVHRALNQLRVITRRLENNVEAV